MRFRVSLQEELPFRFLVATALTATSIAISVQVLTELGKMQTKEARLILGAAIVDDILAIAVLSVVTTMVQTGDTSPEIMDVIFLILQILGLFAALLIGSILLIPKLLHVEKLWKSKGSIEGIVTASFFGAAGIAAFVGLSPIVGAFAVGMAVASTRLIKQVRRLRRKVVNNFWSTLFCHNRSSGRLARRKFKRVISFRNSSDHSSDNKSRRMWTSFYHISKR
jgi:Kef-type K+ transport system membrane component KefB